MNEVFYDTPKDKKIARLAQTIDEFKKYDRKRKAYVEKIEKDNARLLKENAWYKEENEMLLSGKPEVQTLLEQIERLRGKLTKSKLIITRGKFLDKYGDASVEELKDFTKRKSLCDQLDNARKSSASKDKTIAKLKKDKDYLLSEVIKLRNSDV